MTFDQAFAAILEHEGGFVRNPADPGGATKYGISKRSYPHLDIEHLTIEQARSIYLRDYWGPAGCDAVPDGIKFDLFDMAVNAGPRTAIRALQRALEEADDGIIGPRTLQALSTMPSARLIARFNGHRLDHMASLPHWPAFGRGWARRIASNLKRA